MSERVSRSLSAADFSAFRRRVVLSVVSVSSSVCASSYVGLFTKKVFAFEL